MNTSSNQMPIEENIINVAMADQMQNDYYDYGMAVITNRALPSVKDGLKPVHRRILYAMYGLGCTPNSPYKKSARVVGEVIGKYHPHGDISVYEAMVGMSQEFNKLHPLVNGQGNFGSVDGDSAAAMRYCFSGDTLIMTEKGLKRIDKLVSKKVLKEALKDKNKHKEYPLDIFVSTFSDNSHEKATKWVYSGVQQTYEVETKLGYKVTCTENEPFYVKKSNGFYHWVTVKDLELNDNVALNHTSILYDVKRNPDKMTKVEDIMGENQHEYVGKIFFASEMLKIKNPNSEIQSIAKMINNELTEDDLDLVMTLYYLNFKDIRKYLCSLGIEELSEFFKGYVFNDFNKVNGSDAYLIKASSLEVLELFKTLIISYFGSLTDKPKSYHEHYVDFVNNLINTNNRKVSTSIYNSNEDSNHYVMNVIGKTLFKRIVIDNVYTYGRTHMKDFYYNDSIYSITKKDIQPVFDLTVPETNAFIANGFVVHNTEVKLEKIAQDGYFGDIDKNVVDFMPNYDGHESEPEFLPSAYPSVLTASVEGIAVGMASKIPPHNLSEVIDVTLALQANPDLTVDEIVNIMPAPDFPTGGVVYDLHGYKNAVATGAGRVGINSIYHIEENKRNKTQSLVFTEIPYKVNKQELIAKLLDDLNTVKYPQLNNYITDVRDESDSKIRIVIDLKKDAIPELVYNHLLNCKYDFQTYFNYNCTILDENDKPKVMNFKTILNSFLKFRTEIVTKRYQFLLDKESKKLYLAEGLKPVLSNKEEAIQLILDSKDSSEAIEKLTTRFGIDEVQAEEVLKMRIQKLTSSELEKIQNDIDDLTQLVADYTRILNNPSEIQEIIKTELIDFKNKHGKDRVSQYSNDGVSVNMADLVKKEDCLIVLTKNGFVRRVSHDDINTQNKNGKGKAAIKTYDDDGVNIIINSSTHDYVLFFTKSGKVYAERAWSFDANATKGKHIKLIFEEIDTDIISMISIPDFDIDASIVTVTEQGKIKRSILNQYASAARLKNGLRGFNLNDDDSLVTALIANEHDQLMIVTSNNVVNRFSIDDKNFIASGRGAKGVDGVRLDKKDVVVNGVKQSEYFETVVDAIIVPVENVKYKTVMSDNYVLDEENGTISFLGKKYRIDGQKSEEVIDNTEIDANKYLLTISENGVGKKTELSDFKLQKRKSKGLKLMKESDKTGKLIKIAIVTDENEVFINTESKSIRLSVADIPNLNRVTSGSYLMKVEDGNVVDVTIV